MARQLEEINSSGELISIKKGGAGPEKEVTTQEYVDAQDATKQDSDELFNDVKAIMEGGQLDFIKITGGAPAGTADLELVPNVGDFARVQMMKWQGVWENGRAYKWLDVVRDGDWTMIANKDTSERPAPTPIGDKITDQPIAPTFVAQSFLGVVHSGTRFQFTKAGWLTQIEAQVPELSDDTNYRIGFLDQTDPANPVLTYIEGAVLVEDGWATVALGSSIVNIGDDIIIFLDSLNSGGSTQVTGGWTYGGSEQIIGIPAAQGWTKNNTNTLLRIDKTDLDTVNRGTELLGIIPGSDIQFVDTTNPNESFTFRVTTTPVDSGSYVEYGIELISSLGIMDTGSTTTMTADIPVAQATKYAQDTGYWAANTCPFADAEGHLTLNGVAQGAANELFGIRLTFQEANVSEDWDLVAFSGGSSGGGGSASALAYAFDKQTNVVVAAAHPSFTEIARVSLSGAQAGVYEYKISVSYTLNSTTTSAYLAFSIDGGTTWTEFQAEPKDITDTRPAYYAFPIEYAQATPLELIVSMAKESAGDTLNVEFVDAIIDQKTSG